MIKIVTATQDDIPLVLALERESFTSPWTHGALLGEIYYNSSHFALAVEDGMIIGYCILRLISDDECELFKLAVDKEARRRGIGGKLLRDALENAGDRRVYLEARAGNTAAISLYKKHGFIVAGRRKGYYQQPVEEAVVMIYDAASSGTLKSVVSGIEH